jgi:two-component system response regulator NreC
MNATNNHIRVLCVDDHEFLVDGLAGRINQERGMTCVGRMRSAEDLLAKAKTLQADVVTMDLQMAGPDALNAISQLKRHLPNVHVVVLTAHVRDHYIDEAIKSGADGFFSKADPPEQILQGIKQVRENRRIFGPSVLARLSQLQADPQHNGSSSRLGQLSAREVEVLRLVGKGMSRADIARLLCRSIKTVDAHHTTIMRKLDIHDRAELTRFSIREGLAEA